MNLEEKIKEFVKLHACYDQYGESCFDTCEHCREEFENELRDLIKFAIAETKN